MITNEQLRKIKLKAEHLMANSGNLLHDEIHIKKVTNNAIEIVELLGIIDEVDLNLLAVCTYIHDLTYKNTPNPILAYFFEGRWVEKPAKELLQEFLVDEKDIIVILNAIRRHPHSFPFGRLNKDQDIYTKVLQDADTIELFNIDRIKKLFKLTGIRNSLSRRFVSYGSQNLEKYLNYPEVAGYFRSKYIENFEG